MKQRSFSEDFYKNLFIVIYISGYFGARLFSLVVEEDSFRFSDLFEFGGMTLYGGFLSSIFFGSFFVLISAQSILEVFNLVVPVFFLALGIGRLGCFFNGDDFGVVLPLFLENSYIDRYPVQIFESFFCFFLFLYFSQFKKDPGIYSLLCYAIFRFFIEFLRDDFRGDLFTRFFSPAQEISLSFILFIVFYHLIRKRP